MHHDIQGANDAGIDSVFVASGVHAKELGVPMGGHQDLDPATLSTFLNGFTAAPTFVVPGFAIRQ